MTFQTSSKLDFIHFKWAAKVARSRKCCLVCPNELATERIFAPHLNIRAIVFQTRVEGVSSNAYKRNFDSWEKDSQYHSPGNGVAADLLLISRHHIQRAD